MAAWALLISVIGFVLLLILLSAQAWKRHPDGIGTVRCNRCHYVGLAKNQYWTDGSVKIVCPNCGSENWREVERPT
jgi:hypothetical protein